MTTDVLIVGAGASGLQAARVLSAAGKSVTILEARPRLGGRIYPLPVAEFGYAAQGGAEFVHGEAPLTKALAGEAGATLTNPTEWWNVFDGEPVVSEHVSPHDEMLEGALRELTEDMPVSAFLMKYFSAPEHSALREMVVRRVEGYDAADATRASALALLEELTDDPGFVAMNIREGYGFLVEHLAKVCKEQGTTICLSAEVVSMRAESESVMVVTASGAHYEAAHAIITVPLPLIEHIHMTPATPEKVAAAAAIGYGTVIKVLLNFRKKWWAGARERNFEKLFFMFSKEPIPSWWTQYPEPHLTLTGWLGGPGAGKLTGQGEEELVALGLTSLAHIFSIDREEVEHCLQNAKVIDWGQDPYARGAYSYTTPETATAIKTLLEPVAGRIFYAGEALYGGPAEGAVCGTVEAALASGAAAATALLGR